MKFRNYTLKEVISFLGPGLLYAAAAIGVSHLVQSTRAGAEYGLALVWAVVIANIVKFPFFEFAPRYATVTGKDLLDGYRAVGKWAVLLILIVTLVGLFTIQAAVTVVTAGLAEELTGISLQHWQWSGILLLICLLVNGIGHYSFLDKFIKVVIVILALTTLTAFLSAFLSKEHTIVYENNFSWMNKTDVTFLIALMGWMPGPLDISVWHSIWTLAKKRNSRKAATLNQSLFDFHVGYWGSALFALFFLGLGAIIMYGNIDTLPEGGGQFARFLINIYTDSLGDWAYPVIITAAFTTMFSTTLTCLDAFPRVMRKLTCQVVPAMDTPRNFNNLYWIWIVVTALGALILLGFFMSDMKIMVMFATIVSFLTAPVIAYLNYRVIMGKEVPADCKPGKLTQGISIFGIVFLTAFSIYYLVSLIIL